MEGPVECSAVVWLDNQMTAVFESSDGLTTWTCVKIFTDVNDEDLPAIKESYDQKIGTIMFIAVSEESKERVLVSG